MSPSRAIDVVPAEQPQANLVFLIDVSGSMDEPDKLPLLQGAFRLLVDKLRPDDTVSIVTYAGTAGTVLEPTKASEQGEDPAAHRQPRRRAARPPARPASRRPTGWPSRPSSRTASTA